MNKRNFMKRTAALLMCFALTAGLAACKEENNQPTESLNTMASTSVAESTVPETVKAAETGETQGKETQPEETQPEETQAEETQPAETQSAETQPEETQAEETQPKETQPAETQPEETQPKETQPAETQAEETQPETEPPVSVCYLSISCSTILDNMADLEPGKEVLVPSDGVLLYTTEIPFTPGETVFDILQRVTQEMGIHMSSRFTPMYDSAYVEGIGNLYEFDCGSNSGWMYCVNGWYPNYGVSQYTVENGDDIQFHYTCDLGRDLPGGDWME